MKFLLIAVCLAFAFPVFSQTPAFDKNAELGRGINLGNMFEAPSETEWGNPFQDDYMQRIADLGFDHVRIPIRWEPTTRSLASAPYTINQEFLNRIQHVVDLALQHGLHAIINMHHHDALFNDPDGQHDRFISMWKQITDHFSGYPDSLLFELLNEPNGNLTAEKWNNLLADGIQAIRETDQNRFIVVGIAEWGGIGGLQKLQLPADDRLILTIHYYNPFSFTHQGAEWVDSSADKWLGTKWMDTESERLAIESEFEAAIQFSQSHNIPIHVGEFGAYNKADLTSRVRWTTYLGRYLESQNFSWAYWEFSAGFGIYKPASQTYIPELVDALLHNRMPEATPVTREEIIKTGFNTDSNKEGWNLYNNGGASSSGTVSGGNFSINIQNGGTEGWHIQLSLNNILLENGKKYEIQIRAKAPDQHSVSVYTGMSHDPWSAYCGYSSFTFDSDFRLYTTSFQMQNATDSQARLVIDLGKSTSTVSIDEISIYEVSLPTASYDLKVKTSGFYPNPSTGIIQFTQPIKNSPVSIYSLTGQLLFNSTIPENNLIDCSALPSGQYLVRWQSNQSCLTRKLIKF